MDIVNLEIQRNIFQKSIESNNDLNELVIYLESLLNDSCIIIQEGGEFFLFTSKARVEKERWLELEINPDEHHHPQFHLKTPDFQVTFRIGNCSLIDGSISSGDYNKILFWHNQTRSILLEYWDKMCPTIFTVGKNKKE